MSNQIGTMHDAYARVRSRGTEAASNETQPHIAAARVLDDQRPSVLHRQNAADETLYKPEQRLPLTTQWAILGNQSFAKFDRRLR